MFSFLASVKTVTSIQVPGKIHLVLEYCKGGDLSFYIQRHGRVPEAIAKHFMQQLGMLELFFLFFFFVGVGVF